MRRIFIDTEFKNLRWAGRSTLFWVGLCEDTDCVYSASNADVDLAGSSEFVRSRVLSMIPDGEPGLATVAQAAAVREFGRDVGQFWAWQRSVQDIAGYGFDQPDAAALHARYVDWDLRLLRDLSGETASPWQRCHDLRRLADDTAVPLPGSKPTRHHPGHDAAWGREVFLAATADHRGGIR